MQIAIHSSRIVGYDNNMISAICCRKQNGVANYYKLRVRVNKKNQRVTVILRL